MSRIDFLHLERLTDDEQNRLFDIIASGDADEANDAAHQIALGNARLIPGALKKVYMPGSSAFTYDDALIEGYIALHRAALGYRRDSGAKFSTYAVMTIARNVQRNHDDQHRTIRIPIHRVEAARRHIMTHAETNDVDPDEVFLTRGIPSAGLVEGYRDPSHEISEWEMAESDRFIAEFAETFALTSSDTRMWEILCARAGIDDAPQTLDALGLRYGVTRERIRQIEAKARSHALWILQTYYPHLVPGRHNHFVAPPEDSRKSIESKPRRVRTLDEAIMTHREPEAVVLDEAWEDAFKTVAEAFGTAS